MVGIRSFSDGICTISFSQPFSCLTYYFLCAISLYTALLGKQGIVQELGANGIGRGAFGDTTWRIQGNNLTVGALIEVERVDGITLIVKNLSN